MRPCLNKIFYFKDHLKSANMNSETYNYEVFNEDSELQKLVVIFKNDIKWLNVSLFIRKKHVINDFCDKNKIRFIASH